MSDFCRKCVYSCTLSNNSVICQYILVTGQRRGCAAGDGCNRREIGHRLNSIESLIYRGKPDPPPTPEQLAALAAERKDRKKEWRRDWYAANREIINAKRREWRKKRKEQADDRDGAESAVRKSQGKSGDHRQFPGPEAGEKRAGNPA